MISLTLEQARRVIPELKDNFDSHDFIMKYIRLDRRTEREYVEDLYSFRDSGAGIFRTYHQKLGIFLREHAGDLEIEEGPRTKSLNIKGYESGNTSWRKTSRKTRGGE